MNSLSFNLCGLRIYSLNHNFSHFLRNYTLEFSDFKNFKENIGDLSKIENLMTYFTIKNSIKNPCKEN